MPELLDLHPAPADMRALVIEGLSRTPKQLPAWFLYDAEGSRLFELICQQPEYTLTATETELLQRHAHDVAAALGRGTLVEFGAGSARKVAPLLKALRNTTYVALDINAAQLAQACDRLHRQFPSLPMLGICCDYTQLQQLPPHPLLSGSEHMGFFPGSSLGNYEQKTAIALLAQFRRLLGPGGQLLIGIDQPKAVERMEAAYNDVAGISAAFALNLLHRLNRELQGNFDPDGFRYRARWVPEASYIEMGLVSQRQQQAIVAGRRWYFDEGDVIITETSAKYSQEAFLSMTAAAGWRIQDSWSDKNCELSLHLLKT